MILIPIAIFLVLTAMALLQSAWAFGMLWPGIDQQSLAHTVAWDVNITQLPPFPITFGVAIAIFAAGVCALWGAHLINLPLPNWVQKTSIIVLTFIFTIRGIVTYLPNGPFANAVEPFKTLDATFYAPLILAIGAGYAYIWYSN